MTTFRLACAATLLLAGCTVQITPQPGQPSASPSARPSGIAATNSPTPRPNGTPSARPGELASRRLQGWMGLQAVPTREDVTLDSQAELAAYCAALGKPVPEGPVDFQQERVLALFGDWACHGLVFREAGGEVTWAEREVVGGPECGAPLAEVVNLYVLPRGTAPIRGTRPYAEALRDPRATPTPAATPTPVATSGPFPSDGFPERNPAAWPTTDPNGTFNFNGVWARAFNGEPRLTVEACGERWERYRFLDPGADGRDVYLEVDAVAKFVGFGFMHGELVGNREGDEWVFRGTLTTPGPADGPEDHAYTVRLRTDKAGRVLAGTTEHDSQGNGDIRLAPAEVTGSPCPAPGAQ